MKQKPLSPAAMTAKRFFRNRLAVAGLVLLGAMFLFSFFGGILSPYSEHQVFYREELQLKEVASATHNSALRFTPAPGHSFDASVQAQLTLTAARQETSVAVEGSQYLLIPHGTDFYEIHRNGDHAGFAAVDIFTGNESYDVTYGALLAHATGQTAFSVQGLSYRLEAGQVWQGNAPTGYISRLLLRTELGEEFAVAAEQAIDGDKTEFSYGGNTFSLFYDSSVSGWSIRQQTATRVWDSYASPSKNHLLGTDKNGMDLLTRLMYGGRVSLITGFVVVLIAGLLGAVLGAVAGYFGGWTDEAVMRLVDVFYCIPTTPLLIILGALMDALRLDVQLRLFYLMLILGLLGWPEIARLVRGQILSLREQEFMVAAEALGLPPARRVFRHLLPGVFPQLIALCTMRLGATILTEATLSFLGLGIKFPYASWGNIMNDVANVHVLTGYPFQWIPAGVCLVLTVVGFNFVGDGLRDALDPKMKR